MLNPFTHRKVLRKGMPGRATIVVSDDVEQEFERETGIDLEILMAGDAGEVVTKAVLTAGNPQGDVLFGVDNTLLSRALDGDVFEPHESEALGSVDPTHILDPEHRVTPVDR